MYKIGLTGGICTGKSLVLDIFKKHNAYTLKADEIARNILFGEDSPLLHQLSEIFGPGVVNPDSGINKESFSKILFEDTQKRNIVNQKILPLVIKERDNTFEELKKNSHYDLFVYESALLVESGTYRDFDRIIVVYTNYEEQLRRLLQRDRIDRREAEKKIKSQYPLSEKLKVAHYIIDTSGSLENAERKTLETIHLLRKDLNIAEPPPE